MSRSSHPSFLGLEEFGKWWLSETEKMKKIVVETSILDMVKSQRN
jgi:hypothetical protein